MLWRTLPAVDPGALPIGRYARAPNVTVEADAERSEVAAAYESKYGTHLTAPTGTWYGLGDAIRAGDTLVYRVAPSTAFGFGKGTRFSQTRWRFAENDSEVQQ